MVIKEITACRRSRGGYLFVALHSFTSAMTLAMLSSAKLINSITGFPAFATMYKHTATLINDSSQASIGR